MHLNYNPNSNNAIYTEATTTPTQQDALRRTSSSWNWGVEYSF
jgi:hypothetical protein